MALFLEIMGLVATLASLTTLGEKAHKSFLVERYEPLLERPLERSLADLPELKTYAGRSHRAHITSWIKVLSDDYSVLGKKQQVV